MRIDLNFRFFGYAIRFSVAPVSICAEADDLAPEQDDAPVEVEPTPAPVEAGPVAPPAPVKGKPGRKEGWRERQAAKRATEAVNALLAEAPVTVEPAVNEAEARAKRIRDARVNNLVLAREAKAAKEAKRAAAREKRAAKRAAAKATA